MAIKGNIFANTRKLPKRPSMHQIEREYIEQGIIAPRPDENTVSEIPLPVLADTGRDPLPVLADTGRDPLPVLADTGRDPLPVLADTGRDPLPVLADTGRDTLPVSEPVLADTGRDTLPVSEPVLADTGKNLRPKKTRKWKNASNSALHFNSENLTKTEELMLNYIMDECLSRGEKATLPIKGPIFSKAINRSSEAIRQAAAKMRRKSWLLPIQNGDIVNGHHGGTVYRLHENVWDILFRKRHLHVLANTGSTNLPVSLPVSLPVLASPYSSSSINNNITTTTETEKSCRWAIDLGPLTDLGIKLGNEFVQSIAGAGSVTQEQFQEAIYMFAFDLRVNGKAQRIQKDLVSYISGILRKGPYTPPQNYKSPEVERAEAYQDWKRQEAARLEELNDKIADLEFDLWWQGLSDVERNNLSPSKLGSSHAQFGTPLHLHMVKQDVFMKNVWPAIEARIKNFDSRQGATARDEVTPRPRLVDGCDFEALVKNPPTGPFGA